MAILIEKSPDQSRAEQVHIIMKSDINGAGRLFGGRLMEWIDVVAGVVARRHCNHNVTTACIDNLVFKAAAYCGNVVVLKGQVTFVGSTSMEVRVDTFAEALDGTQEMINRAYLVMVALDENDKPTAVPPLRLDTPEQREEWAAGQRRNDLRRERRRLDY